MRAGYKSRDVHEWQGLEGENQQTNHQDKLLQYFTENLSHTGIEPALLEDFSPRHLKPYQLAYVPGGIDSLFLKAVCLDGSSPDTGKGKTKFESSSCTNKVSHGFHLVEGQSGHNMEDYHVAEYRKKKGHALGLFAIFDGHLGDRVPSYLKDNLFNNILEELIAFCQQNIPEIQQNQLNSSTREYFFRHSRSYTGKHRSGVLLVQPQTGDIEINNGKTYRACVHPRSGGGPPCLRRGN
ncbi:PPM-type phosphatase domain-containing protein [Forsythia ovata]|uniref:PPM-type phosphatase domain-containing protein n=1 Tax=Forsythia ovata TaxID=205694 RepID=A0ABD1XCF2_9LAMI